ncbi:regulator, partial [Salmonella enterica]|nr:regulator [Salmonella enterica]EHD3644731.1 regulator [Salmonella enterica]
MSECFTSGSLSRWVKARHMALAGYITKIIILETGLTYKQVRRLYAEL